MWCRLLRLQLLLLLRLRVGFWETAAGDTTAVSTMAYGLPAVHAQWHLYVEGKVRQLRFLGHLLLSQQACFASKQAATQRRQGRCSVPF